MTLIIGEGRSCGIDGADDGVDGSLGGEGGWRGEEGGVIIAFDGRVRINGWTGGMIGGALAEEGGTRPCWIPSFTVGSFTEDGCQHLVEPRVGRKV